MIGYFIQRRLYRYLEPSKIEEVDGERWCQSRCDWCGKPIRFKIPKIPGDGYCSPRCRDKTMRLSAWHNRWLAVRDWSKNAAKVIWILLIVFNGALWGLGVCYWLDLERDWKERFITFGIFFGMAVAYRVARRWGWLAEERHLGSAYKYEKGLCYPWTAYNYVGLDQGRYDPSLRLVMWCLRQLPGLRPIRAIRYPMFFKDDLDRVKSDKSAIESVKGSARRRFGSKIKTDDPRVAL